MLSVDLVFYAGKYPLANQPSFPLGQSEMPRIVMEQTACMNAYYLMTKNGTLKKPFSLGHIQKKFCITAFLVLWELPFIHQ